MKKRPSTRLVAAILAMALLVTGCLFALAGCGTSSDDPSGDPKDTSSSDPKDTSAGDPADDPSDDPVDDPADDPADETTPPLAPGLTVSDTWTTDAAEHWHEVTADDPNMDFDPVADKAVHTLDEQYTCTVCGYQATPTEGLAYALAADGASYTVADAGTATDAVLVIPREHDGKPVTGIDDAALCWYENLTHAFLPNTVTSIGEKAFEGRTSLQYVYIPEGVTSIGEYAFSDCSSLTEITVPNSVQSIGFGAFSGCYDLECMTLPFVNRFREFFSYYESDIPSSIRTVVITGGTVIYGDAFYKCGSIESITLPDGITEIGDEAFSQCTNLESINIPDSVTYIDQIAFSGCKKLIQKEKGIEYVGKWAVGSEDNLAKAVFRADTVGIAQSTFDSGLISVILPDGIKYIGGAFEHCKNLTSINIPDSVTSIGGSTFYNCTSLTNITIPDSVTSIGDSAFKGCESLTSITIPDSVMSIGGWAFASCDSLTSITFAGTMAEWEVIEKGDGWDSGLGGIGVHDYYTIHCTDGDIEV